MALPVALVLAFIAFSGEEEPVGAAGGGPEMALSVKSGAVTCPEGKDPARVCVDIGAPFTLSVEAVGIPAGGYLLAQSWVEYGPNLTYKTQSGAAEASWPDCEPATALNGNLGTGHNNGCLTGLLPADQFASQHIGNLFDLDFNCSVDESITEVQLLAAGPQPQGTNGALYVGFESKSNIIPKVSNLFINCVPGPTSTPTPTPPPIPRMQKCLADTAARDTNGVKTTCDSLVNSFLVLQQAQKVPPVDCLSGDGVLFNEQLSQTIVSADPKNPSAFQQIGAFEFDVNYDQKKVCIDLEPGAAWTPGSAPDNPAKGSVICIVEDSESKPQLEGVARMGCVTVGKGIGIDELLPLATVSVHPQPEVYSQAKPNQDNGVTVQINNTNCDVGDEQGHAIPLFSCDDADITFRYLEGDVYPDCVIDAVDAQAIAFRWGASKGSLVYRDFMNLEPSGTQADNDIDINDLQFVFGRFNSTCAAPHPVQDPVNPKGL